VRKTYKEIVIADLFLVRKIWVPRRIYMALASILGAAENKILLLMPN